MKSVPREFLDGLAEFAAGVRPWAAWPHWFAINAGRLVRQIERDRFEYLRHNPQAGVTTLLHEEGVTIREAELSLPSTPTTPVSEDEYEVYSALCRQFDIFLFDRPDTVFEDRTDRDSSRNYPPPRLEFDEENREYRVIRPGLLERFGDQFRSWFDRNPGTMAQYEARNRDRWLLEKRFEVANGYRFVSEFGEHEHEDAQAAFCLSRVGFSSNGQSAFVFIRHGWSCGFYLMFERFGREWSRVSVHGSWIT